MDRVAARGKRVGATTKESDVGDDERMHHGDEEAVAEQERAAAEDAVEKGAQRAAGDGIDKIKRRATRGLTGRVGGVREGRKELIETRPTR